MTYSMTTNIKHLMPTDPGAELPGPARKLKDFLRGVIMAATASRESALLSALSCRQRINRASCPGLIEAKRQDLPHIAILWHCTECDNGGIVTNWEATPYDLAPRSRPSPPNQEDPELEIVVSFEEHAALRSGGIYDAHCERLIYGARVTAQGVLITGLESDFDNFVGHVAADANHESKVRRRKLLNAVYDKASGALDDSILRHED